MIEGAPKTAQALWDVGSWSRSFREIPNPRTLSARLARTCMGETASAVAVTGEVHANGVGHAYDSCQALCSVEDGWMSGVRWDAVQVYASLVQSCRCDDCNPLTMPCSYEMRHVQLAQCILLHQTDI